MYRCRVVCLTCIQRQLASIIALMLVVGCAAPRPADVTPLEGPFPARVNEAASDPSVYRLTASEQPQASTTQPLPPPQPAERANPDPATAETLGALPSQAVTLNEAIAWAFERQPRLRVYLEGIQQASAQSDIAFAPFYPIVGTGYSVGGFDLNVGGEPLPVGPLPGFTVVPPGFALPVGLNISTGYELAELRLQWLLCDFGRRMGRYNASQLAIDLHRLQTDRAYQTVANEVAVGYYNVLRTEALLRVAQESVVRDKDELEVAEKLAKGGVIEREKVLRAEVKLAESSHLKDLAEEAVGISRAAMNLAIGLKPDESIAVVEPIELPEFAHSLPDCLQLAVSERREFAVAQRTIQIAQEGTRVAKADFAPRIVGGGELLDLQQSSPRGHADVAVGFIRLEWNFFEGGKKVAERRIANSKVREAMAQAETIADTIAFQVNEGYRRLITARRGIDRAKPAVEQANESYRLVRARATSGDATSSEITDAETALTRAEQHFLNSNYDYLTAI